MAALFALGLALGVAMGPASAGRNNENTVTRPAGTDAAFAMRGVYSADVLRVLDGDTFEARVQVWPGLAITTKVRLRGIDAPEVRQPRCDAERAQGLAARDALSAILEQGDVGIGAVALDKYGGRVLAAASTRATPDVSAALLDAGLVRRYSGGRRDSWC